MKRTLICFFLTLGYAMAVAAEPMTAIVARTRSGSVIELTLVSSSTKSLRLGPATEELRIDDPVISIDGLDDLRELESLTIVLLPQIDDFAFLSSVQGITDLTLSHCRFDDVRILLSFSSLRNLRIEMCRSRNGGSILPAHDLDLSDVPGLESIILLDCGIRSLPSLRHAPANLSYVDLSWNSFQLSESSRADLLGYKDVENLIVEGIDVPPEIRKEFPNVRTSGRE